ncbi:MAG: hypothetical protein J0I68_30620 [Achromobacter sp.]|jgi:hypothetical protein|uniref:Uncharacterized protein n=1 Tax=Achromobacter insuavis TaxID=1287735 RepID=A0A6J5A0V3_9BURK|nr:MULTISPECIES: hypothetical protein [Achromobacter]MBN9642919.1 hypothetical protein [Achromobacter sp.]CAB3623909.1 hypothetical protein LMG26845_00243 [Achromobacter insuavis]CUJ65839.1 Uncharacterised protein [Achromobacter sp. 2789STDY5608633]CUJ80295.1 Uncharacterised protein [Achromobacter sp. 2789STDY5608628]
MAIVSTPLLDRLLTDGVIRQEHHDAARQRLGDATAEPWSTLGEALFWLVDEHIVSDEDLAAIGELSVTEVAFASNATRKQALAEMDALMQRKLEEYERQIRQVALKRAFPGPRWAWLGGGAIAVAAAAWYLFAPATPPQCDDGDVQKTLRASLFTSRLQQMSRNPLAGGVAPADLYLATFSDVKEVGYIKPERSRGCTATLKVGEAASALAYTIGPNDKGEMMIAGADPRVVRARYGQLDADGKPRAVGQPAGAARLAAAFEQGAAAFDELTRGAARKAAQDRQRERMGLPPETDTRTVRNIQPLGDCKDLGGGRWSCRLQGEYRDRLMSAIGRADWQVFEGDFEFLQEGDAWRVGEPFTRQYMDAVVRGRVAELKGDEAAARLEQIQRQRPQAEPATPAGAQAPARAGSREHRGDGAVINK